MPADPKLNFWTPTKNAAPIKDKAIPIQTLAEIRFLNLSALIITTNTGANNMSTDAFMADVIDSPLKKASIFNATPKNPAMANCR